MLTLVFAEFGNNVNLNPSLDSFTKAFPGVGVTLYTDRSQSHLQNIDVRVVDSPFDKSHSRHGSWCNDLYKVVGLLEAKTEYAVAVDHDMHIASMEGAGTLVPLTEKFGMCIPANPRYLVKVDNTMGENSDKKFDESLGYGYIPNMSPISFHTKNERMRHLLLNYVDTLTKNPVRGPVAMWRAFWNSGTFPCLLPPQWCVCLEHCGIGNEVILHIGHDKVRNHYEK